IMAYLANANVNGLLTSIDPIYGKGPAPHTPGTIGESNVQAGHPAKSAPDPVVDMDESQHTPLPVVKERTGSTLPGPEENSAISSARTVAEIIEQ
ncbi:hypothetical protein ACCS96_51385, partial [Rhizobium ruizarguesonis]